MRRDWAADEAGDVESRRQTGARGGRGASRELIGGRGAGAEFGPQSPDRRNLAFYQFLPEDVGPKSGMGTPAPVQESAQGSLLKNKSETIYEQVSN